MTALAPLRPQADDPFVTEVLGHLDAQIESSRRLLGAVLRQGEAVRARDVDAVLAGMTAIQTEMDSRSRLELQRTALLSGAGRRLGLDATEVTLERMCTLMPDERCAGAARDRSAELRGLLAEIQREHRTNRALMRQELAFLEHLTRLISREPDAGYRPGERAVTSAMRDAATRRSLDLTA